jgi:hypothetical protein
LQAAAGSDKSKQEALLRSRIAEYFGQQQELPATPGAGESAAASALAMTLGRTLRPALRAPAAWQGCQSGQGTPHWRWTAVSCWPGRARQAWCAVALP